MLDRRDKMKRKITATLLITAACSAGLAIPAMADPVQGFKLNTGVYIDEGDPMLGLSYEIPVDSNVAIVPGFEYIFVDRGDLTTFNVDSRFDLNTATRNPMWAGIGMAAIHREIGNFEDTDFGVNLLWGMDFDRGQNWMPYMNAKAVLSDESYLAIGFGIRFGRSGSGRALASNTGN
jgi:hypothetical protein